MMELTALMHRLKIDQYPVSWVRNYDQAWRTRFAHVLPDAPALRQICRRYELPQEQWQQWLDCRDKIAADDDYLLLWHLYYTVLLAIHDCEDEQWSAWPVPAGYAEGEFSLFRSLLMLAHLDALADNIDFHHLPESFIQDGVDNLVMTTARHYADEGFYGLSNNKMWWLQLFMRGQIFKIGRLQYEISTYRQDLRIYRNRAGDTVVLSADPEQRYDEQGLPSAIGIYHPSLLEYPRKVVGYGYNQEGYFVTEKITLDRREWQPALEEGDAVLSVHIPAEGKLSPAAVEDSLAEARIFFRHYFPGKLFKAFVCHTWLFNTQLKNFLPEDSNILAFQKYFRIIMTNPDDSCLFSFVFDQPVCPLDQLRPKNHFQQQVLDHVRSGKKLYDGYGYRLIDDTY